MIDDFAKFSLTSLEEDIKSMGGWISQNDRKFNKFFTKEIYKGYGEIVDLGCMTGSSTIPLVVGLLQNRNKSLTVKKIHAYDMFVKYWQLIRDEPLYEIPAGCSFLHIFLKNIQPWRDYIEIHQGDICELGWIGKPIEYLFIDIMKSWKIAISVICDFFPFLIPGKSFIVHQDFKHYYTPWIHIIMYRLQNYIRPVFDIPSAGSVVFLTKRAVSLEVCQEACFPEFSLAEIKDAFDYSLGIVAKNEKTSIMTAKAMLFFHLKHNPDGLKLADVASDNLMNLAKREFFKISPLSYLNDGVMNTMKYLDIGGYKIIYLLCRMVEKLKRFLPFD